jgi:hypothetical protein
MLMERGTVTTSGRFELSDHGRVIHLYGSRKAGCRDVFYKLPEWLGIVDFIRLDRR